jgi:hypothetical protein
MDNVVPARSQTTAQWMVLPIFPMGRWEGWVHRPSYCVRQALLGKRRLSLFPFRTTPVVGCVVSSTAAALELLL